MMKRDTVYSSLILGTRANHHFMHRFDWTNGILGISQFDKETNNCTDRVLLSKKQASSLLAFIAKQKGKQ